MRARSGVYRSPAVQRLAVEPRRQVDAHEKPARHEGRPGRYLNPPVGPIEGRRGESGPRPVGIARESFQYVLHVAVPSGYALRRDYLAAPADFNPTNARARLLLLPDVTLFI